MSVHEDIVRKIVEIVAQQPHGDISPTAVAVEVVEYFCAGVQDTPHGYYLKLEHSKTMARRSLATRPDTVAMRKEAEEFFLGQGDLFGPRMQQSYPLPHAHGDTPLWRPVNELTCDQMVWVYRQLIKMSEGARDHAAEVLAYIRKKWPTFDVSKV